MRSSGPEANHRILVVDDNRAIHDDFRKILVGNGADTSLDDAEAALFGSQTPVRATARFQIESAYQGQEGLVLVQRSLAAQQPYAMVFMDVRMPPGMDGIETTRKLWEVDPDLQVVICTAYSDYSWDEVFNKLGNSDRLLILKEPFDTVEVRQLANALTEKWRLLQETKCSLHLLEDRVRERTCELTAEIEERRRAEQQLLIQARAMEAAANAIVITDRDGKIIWVNSAFTTLTGYTAEEATGRNPRVLKSGQHDQKFYQDLWTTISSGRVWDSELINRRKDGTLYTEHMTITPVRGADGEIVRYIAIKQDVTERQRAEEALSESEARFRAVVTNAQPIIFMIDRVGKFVLSEGKMLASLGLQPGEVVGRSAFVMYREYPAIIKGIQSALAGTHYEDTINVGGVIFESFFTPHRASSGELIGVIGMAVDITERKRAEQERASLELQLRHAQKLEAIGHLAAGIAHEINTPTQYIGDNLRFVHDAMSEMGPMFEQYRRLVEACRRKSVTEPMIREVETTMEAADMDYLLAEVPRALTQSLEGVRRVASIVQAMKEFSYPGSNEKTAVDLNRAIESTIAVARNEWKYVADVETDFDPQLPPVPCLPGEFNQVILNILVNAAHAIADVVGDGQKGKGKITVNTRQVDHSVEVRISDTGTGIPEAARARVFDPFFTTKSVGEGTGQGLAIARSVVVDKHSGSITFETEVGHGTTFIIRLPLGVEGSATKIVALGEVV